MSDATPDRALVLTAGLGTRFRPLSNVRAKAAVPVAGQTLIARTLRWLAAHGVRQVVLNLHHRPETIAREVGDGSHLGLAVRYSWESTLLGSAGGPRKALPLIESDRFFIINGDTLTDLRLDDLAADHDRSGALVTMALVRHPNRRRYGGVHVDDQGWISGFHPPGVSASGYHFIGVQVAETRAFQKLPSGCPAESVGQHYSDLIETNPRSVRGFVCEASFADVGTAADYLDTCLAFAAREGLAAPQTGRDCEVPATATLIRTVLWDRVEIGAGCRLTDCVVADGVRLPPGSHAEHAVIVDDAETAGARPGGRRLPRVVPLEDQARPGPHATELEP